MVEHDPCCDQGNCADDHTPEYCWCECQCDQIEKARADERERIARAIEAKHGDPCAWTTKVTGSGPDRHLERVYHCTCVEDASLARGGDVDG